MTDEGAFNPVLPEFPRCEQPMFWPAQVQTWADRNGGEAAVRTQLAQGFFHDWEPAVHAWLAEQERQRADQHALEALEAAQRAAFASERAAQFAMWSAAISA